MSPKAKQLIHGKAGIADLSWSPDGHQIAFLQTEGGTAGGLLAAVPAQTGVIGSGFEDQRLAVVNITTGDTRLVLRKT